MSTQERFELKSETVGAMPIVNWFLGRMGVAEHIVHAVPRDDARLRLAPADVIGVVLRNIIVSHRPLYALGEWAVPFDPRCLGLCLMASRRSTTTGSAARSTACSTRTGRT
ncbi:MAG: DUF4277 domain-containing protein [Acidimicrobiales bacterium]